MSNYWNGIDNITSPPLYASFLIQQLLSFSMSLFCLSLLLFLYSRSAEGWITQEKYRRDSFWEWLYFGFWLIWRFYFCSWLVTFIFYFCLFLFTLGGETIPIDSPFEAYYARGIKSYSKNRLKYSTNPTSLPNKNNPIQSPIWKNKH